MRFKIKPDIVTGVFAAIFLISLAGGWIGTRIANISMVKPMRPLQKQVTPPIVDSGVIAPLDQTAQISGTTYTSLLHNFTISVSFADWKIHRSPDFVRKPEDKIYDVAVSNTAADRIVSVTEQFLVGTTTRSSTLTEEQLQHLQEILHEKVLPALERNPALKEELTREAKRKDEEVQRQYQEAMRLAKAGSDASLWVVVRLSNKDVPSLMNIVLDRKRIYEDFTIESRRYITVDGLMGTEIVYHTQLKSDPRFEKFMERSEKALNKNLDQIYKQHGLDPSRRELTSFKYEPRQTNKELLTLLKHGDYVYMFSGFVDADQPRYADEGIESIRQIINTFKLVDRNTTSFAGISLDKERSEKLLRDQSVADLVETVGKAVLGVTAYDRNQQPLSLGSGFIVTPSGVIVTNFHVVEGAASLSITLENGEVYRGVQIIDVDPKRDVAVIKIEGKNLPSLELGMSSTVRTGDRVIAVGSPEGFLNTVSDGLYNGLRELDDKMDWILTTTPISSGSSGGPLLTIDGQVIGITTASIEEGQNLNLCIPIEAVKGLISESPKRTFADLIPKVGLDDVKQSITQTTRSANSLYQLGYYSECVQLCYLEVYRLLTLIQSQVNTPPGLIKASGILELALRQVQANNVPESQVSVFAEAFEKVLAL